jgi:hypothetical protein
VIQDDAMTELESRIAVLEAVEGVRRGLARLDLLFDAPYDAAGLAASWTPGGYLEACDGQFRGREEIHDFFDDLVATFTMHYATNGIIDVDPSGERAGARWYGWETPVISGEALLGAFSTRQEYERVDGAWVWSGLRETAHFLCAADSDWVHEAAPRVERASQGA